MSDEEFLARWSRRKREAKVAADAPAPAQTAETPNPASPVTAEDPANAELDLSSLPPIDSITAATDVTAFLRQGIPQDLSRAAFRRAWAADPAIRDFVGLAENAWDFNDPHAMPGFGHSIVQKNSLAPWMGRLFADMEKAASAKFYGSVGSLGRLFLEIEAEAFTFAN